MNNGGLLQIFRLAPTCLFILVQNEANCIIFQYDDEDQYADEWMKLKWILEKWDDVDWIDSG